MYKSFALPTFRSRLRQSTDSEPHLDCLSLSGSNVSLNSWCSADNNPPAVFHLAGCDEGYKEILFKYNIHFKVSI